MNFLNTFRMKHLLHFIAFTLLCTSVQAEEALSRREWKVYGITREALLYSPTTAKTESNPLVFVFHGHGGTMGNAARTFRIQELWPEAIVVYMQGLKTPGQLTDPEGKKNGWQGTSGDQGDRDLKFFDVVLESLKKNFKVDTKRIYSTGHSNGGGFTYLLWAERGDQFTAFAPSAATYRNYTKLKPKPALHIAGKNDPLVKFAWQELMMNAVRKINQCNDGQPWEDRVNCTIYPSPIGALFITCIHPGTHQFPSEAPQLIVKFFKSQKQK